MRNGHAPAAQRWLQPQSHTSAATHMHTLQKSANMPMPLHATKTQLPSAPTVSPADTRAARAATVARFRVPWVGTMTSRSVVFEPPSRWSSQIGASVTTASGIDLWARESGSARSRAYSRLRRGKRGSIALSPYGFAPGQYAPSRSRVHLIGTRTLGLSQCTREHPGSGQGWHASSTLVQAGRMLPQPTAAAVCRAAPAGAPTHEGQRPVSSQLPDSSRGRCAPPRSRSSFASAQLGAASPTATGRTLLSQHRAAVARPS